MNKYTFRVEIVDTEYNQDFLTLHINADAKFEDIEKGGELKHFEESLNKINSELEVIIDDSRSMIAFRMPFEFGYSELLENEPEKILNSYLSDFIDLIEPIFKATITGRINKVFNGVRGFHDTFDIQA